MPFTFYVLLWSKWLFSSDFESVITPYWQNFIQRLFNLSVRFGFHGQPLFTLKTGWLGLRGLDPEKQSPTILKCYYNQESFLFFSCARYSKGEILCNHFKENMVHHYLLRFWQISQCSESWIKEKVTSLSYSLHVHVHCSLKIQCLNAA